MTRKTSDKTLHDSYMNVRPCNEKADSSMSQRSGFCTTLSFATLMVAIAAMPQSVVAETWYYDAQYATSHSITTPFNASSASTWTNQNGTAATSFAKTDTLVVSYGVTCTWTVDSLSFPAESLRIGEEDGSASAVFYHNAGTLKGAKLDWNNGTIKSKCTSKSFIEPWRVTVKGSENGTEHLWCYYMKPSGSTSYNIAWGVSGAFTGDANQEVVLKLVSSGCASDPVGSIQQFPFSGDSVNWLGKFTVSDCANYVLGHANAAGSPDVPRADAITLGAHARFAVASGVTPNSARGIKITGEDVRFLAQTFPKGLADCTDYTLNMPISGDCGFSKKGPGRVVIGGAYSAGAIVVDEGTLEILGTATIQTGTEITVKAGATLVSHISLSELDIDAEEGAAVRRVVDPIVVPFDVPTTSATAVNLSSDVFTYTNVVSFLLSEAMPLPQHGTNEFRIMTYAGSNQLSADMFTDITEKTYGLPRTSISIVAENGVQSVRLKTYPVVMSVADINSSTLGINGAAETWSDGLAPHPGADYVLTNDYVSYTASSSASFNGDSLTIAGYIDTKAADTRLVLSSGEPVTIWPPMDLSQDISQTYSSKQNLVVSGKICISGTYGDENAFTFNTIYYDSSRIKGNNRGHVFLSADLTGSGTLALTASRQAGLSGLTGDNSGYTGRIVAHSGLKNDTLSSGLRIWVNEVDNFGGMLDEFRFDAFTLKDKAFLYPENDVSLVTDMNRGFYVSNAGVECKEGVTFTCAWPIRLDGKFSKIGDGTLKIAGPISYGADGTGTTGTMEVRSGRLSVLSDAAVAGLSVVFSNGTSFAVGCGLSTGLTVAPSVLPADGTVDLSIDEDTLPGQSQASISATVATLPSGSDDIRPLFALPRRIARYAVLHFVKRTVEKDSVSYDVYELQANVKGVAICIR